jgi:hypothetical protein
MLYGTKTTLDVVYCCKPRCHYCLRTELCSYRKGSRQSQPELKQEAWRIVSGHHRGGTYLSVVSRTCRMLFVYAYDAISTVEILCHKTKFDSFMMYISFHVQVWRQTWSLLWGEIKIQKSGKENIIDWPRRNSTDHCRVKRCISCTLQ